MSQKPMCKHVYVAGPKKGQSCGRFCRSGGEICGEHRPRVTKEAKCEHNRRKRRCKDCGGSSICEHNRQKYSCKDCGGSSICEHNRIKHSCKDCGGSSICKHNRQKHSCKDCGGSAICEHNRMKYQCKDCGGSSICEHNRIKHSCKDCGGSAICEHKIQRRTCSLCDPIGHLTKVIRGRVHYALKTSKTAHTIDYLGCDMEAFRCHIEGQFEPGMTWDNYGSDWHVDHIVPLKYPVNGDGISRPPTLDEVIQRLDFMNCQPMRATENIAKGNRYIGKASTSIYATAYLSIPQKDQEELSMQENIYNHHECRT